MLKEKLKNRESGIIFYGLTPPKSNNTKERIEAISIKHRERIEGLDIDGVIVYDIQDETDRTHEERPFEFIHTVDPSVYSQHYLKNLKIPRVVYRCVGNYNAVDFTQWLKAGKDDITVFVGTAASHQEVGLKLLEAYALRRETNENVLLGGVTIPERHMVLGDEDQRVGFKLKEGCSFFVSQAVYDLEASKKFLIDYKNYCLRNDVPMVPIIFTLTPCGSEKTLKFIKWLGISVPEWLENKLLTSEEMLEKSVEVSTMIYKELSKIAKKEGIPIGCNIESVSIRKEEIEASIQLAKDISLFVRAQKV